jgi:deoxyribodipyrimidine photo-lyase
MPKRKAPLSIPPNAASAASYTDPSGTLPNKRSRRSQPDPQPTTRDLPASPSAAVTNGRGFKQNSYKEDDEDGGKEEAQFDHSRPEERSGIVDRRFYPSEMSNERCAMYNANEIARPMERLNTILESTKGARNSIKQSTQQSDAVVHWFKRDLRVGDNTGLSLAGTLARERGVGVIGVWILSPQDWEAHLVSPAKCDFELRSVEVLRRELGELDIPLHIEVVEDKKDVPKVLVQRCEEWGVKSMFCNIEYEIDELRREMKLVQMMLDRDIAFEPQHDDCVVPPGSLRTGAGKQYAVYTPWYRAWVAHLHAHPDLLQERPPPPKNPAGFRAKFEHLFDAKIPETPASKQLTAEQKDRFAHLYPAGEAAALDRLLHFLTEKIGRYAATRNFPSQQSTASVSMHHAAGTLAARTSVRSARDVNSTKKLDAGNEGIKGWIGEVAWRDFYRHVLVNWPYIW